MLHFFGIIVWKSFCIRNGCLYTRQKAADRHGDQYQEAWSVRKQLCYISFSCFMTQTLVNSLLLLLLLLFGTNVLALRMNSQLLHSPAPHPFSTSKFSKVLVLIVRVTRRIRRLKHRLKYALLQEQHFKTHSLFSAPLRILLYLYHIQNIRSYISRHLLCL